ncbi:MAG: hypothetical protein WCY97_03315 [Methanothrix sp.]|jgi:hypothetical protein|uniref:Uncharacterized protein n=1 Tax=Methanothrix harundinacea TaxID=301375 RepID=A0A117MD78_9EURY|nr:MAG: hypothetical protein APR56_09200 [Methanosaeta sp. SDB]KUK43929.1 MAG: hypothetical protein XD72_1696 [Methanothrix harundinacea]MDD2637653.1 hypothetical protein [Methanothrix sp.]MDI9399694.1 hypothetical protein [Euryarchaeota archaeon]KUK97676.1 MAG: hypothetical protein XE07_0090 [Methanothrix harundinacea]
MTATVSLLRPCYIIIFDRIHLHTFELLPRSSIPERPAIYMQIFYDFGGQLQALSPGSLERERRKTEAVSLQRAFGESLEVATQGRRARFLGGRIPPVRYTF